jgi:hypothetical protein
MKLFYFLFISIIFFSCNNNKRSAPEDKQQETPKALQSDNSGAESSFSLKKRGYSDLVDELYNELLEKNAALSTLEYDIENIKEDSKDSAALFNAFDNKNSSYYDAATRHLGSIKDSVLKERIKFFVTNSLSRYKAKTTTHNDLLAAIAAKDINLDDLHVILKLTQTLGMIEQYQTGSLPSTKPLENTGKAYDKLIATTDSLGKK